MRATTAILALAGSALAAPHYNKPVQYKEVQNVHVVYETVVHTVYHTEGYGRPSKPTKATTSEAPAVTTTMVEEEYTPAPAPSSVVVEYSEAPAPAPTSEAPAPTSAAPAPSSTASGYMGVVDTWRAKMGMDPIKQDAKLESNAMDTVVASNGQMIHKLNEGSMGQVLAPGNADGFEHVFVGGWLCEIPTLPGLDGVCQTASEGWAYEGQTGHAKILSDPKYTKIGCALHAGIWCCDVGY